MAEMLHPSVGGFSDAGLGWAHHSVPGAFAQQGPLTACKARVMEPQKLSACSSVTSAKTRGFHTQLDEGPETP